MKATMAAKDLKSRVFSASLDQPQPPGWPVLTQHPHTQVLSTRGFLSWKTHPLLCTCQLPISQILFCAKKPSLTLGLCWWPSALASWGGAPISAPLWCPLAWSGATEGSCCPGHPSHQRFPRTLCTEFWSLSRPVGSGRTGQCDSRPASGSAGRWHRARFSHILVVSVLLPNVAHLAEPSCFLPHRFEHRRTITWGPGWNVRLAPGGVKTRD